MDHYRGELTITPHVDETGLRSDYNYIFSGTLKLFDKKSNKFAQQFHIPYLISWGIESIVGMRPLIRVKSIDQFDNNLQIEDINFDGIKDLAIPMNDEAGYSGIEYDIYIYNKAQKKYIRNNELSELVSSQGTFYVDQKKKLLIVYEKSGYSWHMEKRYKVTPKGAIKVYERTNDQTRMVDESGC